MPWYRLARSGVPYFTPGRPPRGAEIVLPGDVVRVAGEARLRALEAEAADLARVEAQLDGETVPALEEGAPVGTEVEGVGLVADEGEELDRPAGRGERRGGTVGGDEPPVVDDAVRRPVKRPVKRPAAGGKRSGTRRVDGSEGTQ